MLDNNKNYVGQLLVMTCVLLVVHTSAAQKVSGSIEDQLLLCAGRVTDNARLACYDGLAESLRSAAPDESVTEDEPATVVKKPEPVQSGPKVDASAGVPLPAEEQTRKRREPETFDTGVQQKQSIRVMLEKTKRNARGDWYFYFDNGEVWKQVDSRYRRIPPLPVAVTVSRGLFSSHKLHIDGEVWAMKVRRVK